MKTPSLKPSSRSKPKVRAGRFPRGIVPELAPAASAAGVRKKGEPAQRRGAVNFHLEAPAASTVKLAADFTGWDKRPLDCTQIENGIWRLSVVLPPGRYAYRFLVDGEWCDDPHCTHCEANPYGTMNAVIEIA